MAKHKVPIKYNHGHFNTQGVIEVEARGIKSAKTKALKLAKIRAKEDKFQYAELYESSE